MPQHEHIYVFFSVDTQGEETLMHRQVGEVQVPLIATNEEARNKIYHESINEIVVTGKQIHVHLYKWVGIMVPGDPDGEDFRK